MLPLVMIRVGSGHQPQVTATDIQPSMGMAETEARQPSDAAPTGLHETKASGDGRPIPHVPPRRWRIRPLINVGLFSMTFALVWFGGCSSPWLSNLLRDDLTDVRPDDRTRAEAIESSGSSKLNPTTIRMQKTNARVRPASANFSMRLGST